MAELILKPATPTTRFGCYSERGLMSYFMFVALPTHVGDFLADLRFPEGVANPFEHERATHPQSTIFSELNFGSEGFGCPDGAVFVEGPDPSMVFLETKLNESYEASCRKSDYNSTIQGQLELRWRLTELHRSRRHRVHGGTTYIQETADFRAVYEEGDAAFYRHESRQDEAWRGSWRRLRILDGVKAFLDLLALCEQRVYFCAITKDERNPFDVISSSLRPRCGNGDWEDSRRQFCWLPVGRILGATPGSAERLSAGG
ncbi:MAG: hypothetical protein JWN86_1400 [Planctomycetota bacterium]|nr:hypothetical protein [Planctomycetota bacterium]